MNIHRALLHILEFNPDLLICSQKDIDFSDDNILEYLEKHINHIYASDDKKPGSFDLKSVFEEKLVAYQEDNLDFETLSQHISNTLFRSIVNSDKKEPIDLLIIDFSREERRYLGLILFYNKIAYTHQVMNNSGIICNNIIRYYAILPSTSSRPISFALVDMQNKSIFWNDVSRMIGGKDVFVLPEIILQCSMIASAKEAVKTVRRVAEKVAQDHGGDTTAIVSKVKNYIFENSEISDYLSPCDLGRRVFGNSEEMQNDFEKSMTSEQIPDRIYLGKKAAVRTGKSHRIKTDTGIEIIFPSEYIENHQYLNFINNPNGTISIEITNVNKILNK